MAGVCPACQARKTTSARASAVESFAQGKAPSALTVQGQGPGSRVAGAELGDKSMSCALGRALHGGLRSVMTEARKYALPALFFFCTRDSRPSPPGSHQWSPPPVTTK
jgi:hypothetical protein